MSYPEIYYYLCSTTGNHEFAVNLPTPLECPYHGGSVDANTLVVANSNRFLSDKVANNSKDKYSSSSFEQILNITGKGAKNAIMREVSFLAYKDKSADSYDFRIYDSTNNQIIASQNNILNETPTKMTLTNIENQPYDDFIMELQIKAEGKKTKYVYLSELEIVYEKI